MPCMRNGRESGGKYSVKMLSNWYLTVIRYWVKNFWSFLTSMCLTLWWFLPQILNIWQPIFYISYCKKSYKPLNIELLLSSHQVRSNSFETPWTAACQASLTFTISLSLLKLMFIELVMPSNYIILCQPLLLLSIFPSIRVFSCELTLCIRWPKYWSFSINPLNEYSGLISLRIDWFDLLAVLGTLKSLLQHHSSKASMFQCSAFFTVQLSFVPDYWKNHSFDYMDLCQQSDPWAGKTPCCGATKPMHYNYWRPNIEQQGFCH